MVAGWKLTTFVPLSPHDRDQADRIAEIRRMAEDDPDLAARLDGMGRNVQLLPPYLHAGRLVLFLGVAAFIAAALQMARAPAEPPRDESRDPDTEDVADEEVAER